MNLFIFLGTVLLVSNKIDSQRVAPGVPPQQYQQVPQQQYHQPPPPQYQQVPGQQQYQQQPQQQVQYQQQPQVHQVPQQQFQQPEQHHQQVHPQQVHPQQAHPQQAHPQQGGHQHGHHGQKQQILNAANIQHEREHIAEHMEVPIDTSKMSEQELQFHYFKMHDSDNNNKLDGCELIKSLIHWHDHEGKQLKDVEVYTDDQLVDVVDYVLELMDKNKDGYVDWAEYKTSDGDNN